MAEKQKIIMPGENITTEEEYVPRRNTFAKNGVVKSKILGVAKFDDTNKEVSVTGKSIREIRTGDIIIGKVILVKESTAVIELTSAEGGKRITGMKTAQIPVRNISTEYISEIRKTMKIGDLVRAKITMTSPLAIDLATNEKGLGVIKAYCSNCRQEMQYSNGKLNCPSCWNVEERKWFEAEQKPREFHPREDFGGNREFRPRREGAFRPNNDRGRDFRPRNEEGTYPPRAQSGFGHHSENEFNSNTSTDRGAREGREVRRQGQGFGGYQNRPRQRW